MEILNKLSNQPNSARPDAIDIGKLLKNNIPNERPKTTKDRYKEIRKEVYLFLERPETKLAINYHLLNLILIIGSIMTNIVSTIEAFEENDILNEMLFYYELALLAWFSVEYLVRLWSCSFLSKYKGFTGRLLFMKTMYMMIDAFVIVSTLCTAILSVQTAYFTMLRVTRFLQIFRILRLDRQRGDLRTMGRVVYKHRKELVSCYFVGFIILFGGTYMIFIVENVSSEQTTINNMANGLYWAMITVTSIGYGDISPETWPGKLITGIFALVGCAFFALPAGILGSGFALQVAKQKKQLRFVKVRNPAAVVIQMFWRNYTTSDHGKNQLQATWYYFFPRIFENHDTAPELYIMLPGINEYLFNNYVKSKGMVESSKVSEDNTTKEKGSTWSRLKAMRNKANTGMGPSEKKRKHSTLPLSKLLNSQHKQAIRFILKVKLFNSIKTFKNIRYPFVNVQDIMEKSFLFHTETMAYLKNIQIGLNDVKNELKELRTIVESQQLATSLPSFVSATSYPTLDPASIELSSIREED